MNKSEKIIIFDLDGTIYRFKRDSFRDSGLYDTVIENTLIYISNKLEKTKLEAQEILGFVLGKYGNSISIGLEKEFKINRYDYFNSVWDIDAEEYVQFDPAIGQLLAELQKRFCFVLLSDAPMIWIHRVLNHLRIKEFFQDNIFSGEGDIRKELGNALEEICRIMNINANNCIIVGDQEETDIIPAKKIGMKTIFIGNNKSNNADFTANNISEIKNILKIYE